MEPVIISLSHLQNNEFAKIVATIDVVPIGINFTITYHLFWRTTEISSHDDTYGTTTYSLKDLINLNGITNTDKIILNQKTWNYIVEQIV